MDVESKWIILNQTFCSYFIIFSLCHDPRILLDYVFVLEIHQKGDKRTFFKDQININT